MASSTWCDPSSWPGQNLQPQWWRWQVCMAYNSTSKLAGIESFCFKPQVETEERAAFGHSTH
eukprot:4076334-Karenia_brevis.AAC.1